MVTQPLFLLPSSKPLRVATLYPWRKDAAPTDTGDRAGRAICMGVVPIQAATGVPVGEMAAHLAIGVAPGVTAVTRRSTEGIRTGRGIRPHGHEDSPYFGGRARGCELQQSVVAGGEGKYGAGPRGMWA
jgi:hypothetical protein